MNTRISGREGVIASSRSGQRSTLLRTIASLSFFVLAALALACTRGGDSTEVRTEGATGDGVPQAASRGFAIGPAVLVPPGYQPPTDRVDSTGAYLPVNDRPTLVYLEAIW
jgi:hypothetical protein